MNENPYRAIEHGGPGTIGWRIHHYAEIGSTQDVAEQLALDGAAHGLVVIAESQTAGRGRLGREWFSPAGVNLHATVILRPKMAAADVPILALVAGVAMAEAVETVAPGLPGLKWPNDLWLREKKAGGMIAQLLAGTAPCVLLGFGVNLNLTGRQLPAELRDIATSVLIETGQPCDRVKLAATLFAQLDERIQQVQQSGFGPIAPLWERYSVLTGRHITVFDGHNRYSGAVKGIDHDGALLLVEDGNIQRVLAGDVTVEKLDRQA
jgi:BirA family transcriptional regulator, biotin operon repressor / biotin---[acetyl-CoA-carboxylase] ligase